MTDRRKPRARLTVVESVHHVAADGTPTTAGVPFQRWLDTDDPPYRRTGTASGEWSPLPVPDRDTGVMVLANLRAVRATVPTPGEAEAESACVLEVSFFDDGPIIHAIVRPGEDMRVEPADASSILVRCRNGSAKYSVTLFPR